MLLWTFGAAFLLFILACSVPIRGTPPVHYSQLPVPIWGPLIFCKRSSSVRHVFTSRENARLYKWKKTAYIKLVTAPDRLVARLFQQPRHDMPIIRGSAKYYLLWSTTLIRVGGYASQRSVVDTTIILGLEKLLIRLGPITRSAADHELIHCVQNDRFRTFQAEWDRTISFLHKQLHEASACCFGSTLLTLLGIFVLVLWFCSLIDFPYS